MFISDESGIPLLGYESNKYEGFYYRNFFDSKISNNLNVEQLGNGFKKPVDSNAVIKNNNF